VADLKGILMDLSARDVDGDGSLELVMLGYNTILDAPIIIALDPECIEGSSPGGARYDLHGMGRDVAKFYVKLPFYHRFIRYNYRTYPLHIDYVEGSDGMKIIVKSRAEEVVFTISEKLTFSDAAIVSYNSKNGVITPVDYPGAEKDEQELLRGIRYWDGEDWVADPAINRSYLERARKGG